MRSLDARTVSGWDDFNLDQIYILRVSSGIISDDGMSRIKSYLSEQNDMTIACISNVWLVTDKESDGGRTGTFPKRVAKYIYKSQKKRLTAKQKQRVGELAKAHTVEAKELIFDITQDLDWTAGDYGDRSSCFWGDMTNCRIALIDSDQYAMRTYKRRNSNNDFTGTGRAWMLDSGLGFVLTNAYGPHAVNEFGNALALTLGWRHNENVTVHNTAGGFHFNRVGQQSYVAPFTAPLLSRAGIHFIAKVSIEVDSNVGACACGNVMNEEEGYYVEWLNQALCEDCYCDAVAYCFVCEEDFRAEDAIYADDETYCETCHADTFSDCEICDESKLTEELKESDTLGELCAECWKKEMIFCEGCEEDITRQSLSSDDICPLCQTHIKGEGYIGSPFEGWAEVESSNKFEWIIRARDDTLHTQMCLDSLLPYEVYVHPDANEGGSDLMRNIGTILKHGYTAVYNPTGGMRQIEVPRNSAPVKQEGA